MAALVTLAGERVTSARITIPASGCWYVEASLDGEHTLSGSVETKIGDLTMRGTVVSGGAAKGRSMYRVVAGAGGWGRTIKPASYATDLGVKLSKIVGDAARLAGETLDASTVPSSTLGPAFVRPEGPASRVLELVAPAGWYVGEDGTTRLGRRAARALSTAVPRVSQVDRARGSVTLAPESFAELLPGITVDGLEAVVVHHEVTPEAIRTTIWGTLAAGASTRRLAAFRAIIDQLDPDRVFRGVYEYRVEAQSGERLDLRPLKVSTGMPSLQRVFVRPGVPGMRANVALGCRVLVAFVDSDPARPAVVAFEDADGAGFTPLLLEIDASTFVRIGTGALPAIRSGDLAGGIWPCVPTQTKTVI